MIVAFIFQEDTGRQDFERARVTVASIRKHMPWAPIVQLARPESNTGLAEVDEVLRVKKLPGMDFIDWCFAAQGDVCARGQHVLFLATDMILQESVREVFDRDFAFAGCRYPSYTRDDGTFCGDGIFFNARNGLRFMMDIRNTYRDPKFRQRDGWEGGQTALLDVTKRTDLKVLELPFNRYNFTPEVQGDLYMAADAAIVHFRGPRKAWMLDYARRIGL